MSKTVNDQAGATVYDLVEYKYKENRYLGGLVKARRLVTFETIHNELHIYAPPTDKVFLNGLEVTRKHN